MTFEQFTQAIFEDHWLLMSVLSPGIVALWAFATKQWGWFVACIAWRSVVIYGHDAGRDKEISTAVVKKLREGESK